MTELLRRKAQLRRAMRERRTALQARERQRQQQRLCRRLGAQLGRRRVASIGLYLAMGSEFSLSPLLRHPARSRALYAPRICGTRLRFLPMGGALQRHPLGMLEPRLGPARRVWSLSVLLLPLLACDRQGRRLGQGGGYYDRTLATARPRRPLCIGVGFDPQLVDELPTDRRDQSLDIFLSASQVLAFSVRGERWLTGY